MLQGGDIQERRVSQVLNEFRYWLLDNYMNICIFE